MKQERLFRAIGEVGDDLIARADQPVRRQSAWVRWGALAACCALVIGLASLLPSLFGAKSAAPNAARYDQMPMESPETPMEMPAAQEPETEAEESADTTTEQPAAPVIGSRNITPLDGAFTSAQLVYGGAVVEIEAEALDALVEKLRTLETLPESASDAASSITIRLFEGETCAEEVQLPCCDDSQEIFDWIIGEYF